ncbi:hypothetical protein Q9R08_06165 [Microbacterium sp. QXD-8]|uniref:Uncharacterized protein n=1 Tax=Microbacterium psychrotolerans TaxID=3068321 RepID=A0ABU0YYZ3_9MICO|nr:hypothetical protein [Microbacterium sp. QXD-8]MDQ7877557.1 hypothetical protein [Microbacterium sp. QXD-8]
MTRDAFDDLLDRSAPATREPLDADLAAMIAEARTEVPRPRRHRIAIASGVLAIALVGGAGVAVATDGFSWAPWAQDPVGAVSFSMSNGFDCELRFSRYTAGSDPAFLADVNRTLEDWYRATDVVGRAQARIPQQQEDLAAMRTAEEKAELDAQLAELSPQERAEAIAHNAWADEWIAWELVVSDLETAALREAGFAVPDERFVGSERGSQIQCFDEDGEPYGMGAGS